jgi:two-component system response regulator NreC
MAAHLRLASAVSKLEGPDRADVPIRVVLADNHRSVRRTLRLLLDGEPGVGVVAEASDLPDVVRHVRGQLPHALVLDLQMPGGSSIEAIRSLRREVPETRSSC